MVFIVFVNFIYHMVIGILYQKIKFNQFELSYTKNIYFQN